MDGSLAALSGHVGQGVDMIGGSGRGDADCLGSGTAMASLIVAQPGVDGNVKGIAPEAIVLPVRVAGNDSKVQPADGAAAVEAAAKAGATVIALGRFVDPGKPAVAQAIAAAVDKGVVVVASAPLGSEAVDPQAAIGAGVLRVARSATTTNGPPTIEAAPSTWLRPAST
ncbi:S8 family serine peptidase [Actinoplanes sp. NPDC089786]|uniref:S8 family serine peptidase n=1 Tax=Actinoplanes sp. NPDC089786 TaxID=3155185 RepID=UPI003414E325